MKNLNSTLHKIELLFVLFLIQNDFCLYYLKLILIFKLVIKFKEGILI
jgi:hypothetical protein